jgi:hypothetical protein
MAHSTAPNHLPREPRRDGRWVTARVWLACEPCWKCGVRGAWPVGVTLPQTVGEHPAGMLVEITFCAEAIAAAVSAGWLARVGAGPIEYRHSPISGEWSWTNTCRSCGVTVESFDLVHEPLPELSSEGMTYEDLPSSELAIPTGSL